MNQSPSKFSSSQKDIRQRLHEALRRFGYKQVDVSKETNIHHSTLSLWLQGKIKGHQVRIEETIENWLQNLYSNKPRFTKSFTSKFYQVREDIKKPKDLLFLKDTSEIYIPIQIKVNFNNREETTRILWNYNESVITPEQIAKIILDDNGLPNSFESDILNQIKRGLETYESNQIDCNRSDEEKICFIELEIKAEGIVVRDMFEWDLFESGNNPLEFAQLMVGDLGLPQVFENLICFEIHRQLYAFKKFLGTKDNLAFKSHRQKKSRGRVRNVNSLGDKIRKNVIKSDICFRPIHILDKWSPQLFFSE